VDSYIKEQYPYAQYEFGTDQIFFTTALWYKPLNFEGAKTILELGIGKNTLVTLWTTIY
jgi:hypothetical protein